MNDPRTTKLAKLLVEYSARVQPGDWVVIRGTVAGAPLVRELVRETLAAGGHPTVLWDDEQVSEILLRHSSDAQIEYISPMEPLPYAQADALIRIGAPENTRALAGVDPARQRLQQVARRPLMEEYLRRGDAGELNWVVTQYPCPALAQESDMGVSDYADFVFGATLVDREDPIAEWQRVHDMQERLVQWLRGKRRVVVRGPNAELSLSIEGRTFINSDGRHNMPSGEIFTGPVEDSVEGWIRFTYPAIHAGREVEGIRLAFEQGVVVEATAEKNEAYLQTLLDSDEGARRVGEFAIGTNDGISRFTKSILFDEKIGGTIHVAVGAGYPSTGSVNRSAIHWDMICDMRDGSEILVDGDLFYRNGKFLV